MATSVLIYKKYLIMFTIKATYLIFYPASKKLHNAIDTTKAIQIKESAA